MKNKTSIFYNSSNKLNPHRIKQEWIDKNYPEFNDITSYTTDIREKIYAINNNISEAPLCKCNNILKFNKTSYNKYCSTKCSMIFKKEDTIKGVREKYGKDNFFQTEEFQEKRKITTISKFGVDHHMKCKQISDKVNKSRDEEKSKAKRLETNIRQYGLNNTFGLIKSPWNKDKTSCSFENIDTTSKTLNELADLTDSSYSNTSRQLIKQGLEFKFSGSKMEESINEEFNNIFALRTRKIIAPFEIDLYSEEFNLAIEYNGLIWHSYGYSNHSKFHKPVIDSKKHLNKTLMCEENNIQLFHIFENEWLDVNKKSIWVSMINDKQGLNTKIGARKCTIKEVKTKEARKFIEENHMQGYSNAKIKIGLYYDNLLVSIMTFGKSRFDKNIEYELIRFCTKKGYTVQGGGSRLLKFFEKEFNPISLISYANRRWSTGNFYIKSGFDFMQDTSPNYFYFKPGENILWSRNKFQKHKLAKILKVFNNKESETENMFNNGFRKIFDSGNKKFLKIY